MSMYGHKSRMASGKVAMAAANSVAGQLSCGMMMTRPVKIRPHNTRRWMTVSRSNMAQAWASCLDGAHVVEELAAVCCSNGCFSLNESAMRDLPGTQGVHCHANETTGEETGDARAQSHAERQ